MEDIDFPVSQDWAEFYASQGLSVTRVITDQEFEAERKLRKGKPDPENVKALVKENVKALVRERSYDWKAKKTVPGKKQVEGGKIVEKIGRLRKWMNS